jgi:hypothetical protein
MSKKKSNWIPEILYEDDSQIPFIEVPRGEQDPALLFIFINRKTGETEPGPKGEELPVYDMELRQFADLSILASKLTPDEYDRVRAVLGLEKRSDAARKGKEITQNVATKVSGKLD